MPDYWQDEVQLAHMHALETDAIDALVSERVLADHGWLTFGEERVLTASAVPFAS